MSIHISSAFDGGNIEVLAAEKSDAIRLNIRKDSHADYFQWFHFRLQGAQEQNCVIQIKNAHEASYPDGWKGYLACASYDREEWFRVPTFYDGNTLTIEHTPEANSIYFAYFAPYSYDRHLDLVHQAQNSSFCKLECLGQTVEGRDIDLLVIGDEEQEEKEHKKIWIIARQHPGETMASWFMEGLIARLLDEDDPVCRTLLEKATFYLVPNMNIDGSIHGNLRANAAGTNLNREWAQPNKDTAPEVYYVKQKMDATGVDLMLDIHGDEGLPYNFVSSIEGIPNYDSRLRNLLESFKSHWQRISPDFQVEQSYPVDEPGKGNLNICSKQIGHRYNCLSVTIEMPFKDNNDLPDLIYGWSPARAAKFGQSVIGVIGSICDQLR